MADTLRHSYIQTDGTIECQIWTAVTRKLLSTLPSHLSVFFTAIRVGKPAYSKQYAIYKGSISEADQKCTCGAVARHLWKHAQSCTATPMVEARTRIAQAANFALTCAHEASFIMQSPVKHSAFHLLPPSLWPVAQCRSSVDVGTRPQSYFFAFGTSSDIQRLICKLESTQGTSLLVVPAFKLLHPLNSDVGEARHIHKHM